MDGWMNCWRMDGWIDGEDLPNSWVWDSIKAKPKKRAVIRTILSDILQATDKNRN